MHLSHESMPITENLSAEEVKKVIQEFVRTSVDMLDTVEYDTMRQNLDLLDNWCKKHSKQEFFELFQDMVISSYCRACHYRQKVWAKKDSEPKEASAKGADADDKAAKKRKEKWKKRVNILTGFFKKWAPIILSLFTVVLGNLDFGEVDPTHILLALGIGTCISLPFYILDSKKQEQEEVDKKHKYYETWVRHTLCDSRLRLALSKFVASSRENDDFEELVKSTFAILEQNLDQFAVNVCPNGMASRAKENDD